MKMKNKSGLDVVVPSKECNDKHCPFHNDMPLRGRQIIAFVKSTKANKSATVEWLRLFYVPKYQRYEKRMSKVSVHVPDCIDINEGDKVKVVETRPISKTKNFVVVEVIK